MIKIALLIFILQFSVFSFATTIKNVKGAKALLVMDTVQFAVGEKVFGLTDGKRKVLMQITAVKNGQAVATILKGTAAIGMTVEASPLKAGAQAAQASQAAETTEVSPPQQIKKTTRKSEKSSGSSSESTEKVEPIVGQTYGVLIGITQNSMSLQAQYKPASSSTLFGDLTMSGMGFTIKGFGDYSLNEQFNIRYGAGLETFNVKGSAKTASDEAICDAGTSFDCKVSIMYVGADGALQYNINNDYNRTWFGIGYSFLFAATKSINVENLKNPSTNQILAISVGFDWRRGPHSFIPFQFDYSYIPGAGVTTNGYTLRSGFTF